MGAAVRRRKLDLGRAANREPFATKISPAAIGTIAATGEILDVVVLDERVEGVGVGLKCQTLRAARSKWWFVLLVPLAP